jgi:serine/threonine protein kinase
MQTHFSQETFHFLQRDEDNNGVQWLKAVAIPENPASDCTVAAMLRANGLQSDADAEEREMVSGLGDLLEKCLALNRSKRVSASDALQHAFFNQE